MTSIYVDYELDSCSHISYVSTRINPYQNHSYCNYWYQYLSKFKWDVVSIHLKLLRWLGYLRETPGFASLPRNRFAIIDKWTISSPYIKKRQWGENIKFFLKNDTYSLRTDISLMSTKPHLDLHSEWSLGHWKKKRPSRVHST